MRAVCGGLLAVHVSACGAAAPRGDEAAAGNPLALSPIERDALPADLRTRLSADPHDYFRYIGPQFTHVECSLEDAGPVVNLHGDAHLGQYLVTSLGRGMGDFDETTTGPVAFDLLRLAASIHLIATARSWDPRARWNRFLEGYVEALADPGREAPEPSWVTRTVATFRGDHAAAVAFCADLMEPVEEVVAARIELVFEDYVVLLRERHPELDPQSLQVVGVGTHRLGVGSRRVTKYLIRTQGPSSDPGDDLVFEAKEITTNPDAQCLPISRGRDPLRILVGQSRLAYAPFERAGYLELDGSPFWVHEWLDDYQELDPMDPALSEADLDEVLLDIGVQLGRGHPRTLNDPYDAELRAALLTYVGSHGATLLRRGAAMAELSRVAWADFRR